MSKTLLACVVVLLISIGSGCTSLTFDRDWNNAVTNKAPSDGVTGQWAGSWQSNSNGHTGSLRCIITKTDTKMYQARFFARYFGELIAFEYTVDMQPKKTDDGAFYLEGQANLGTFAGGIYQYKGHVKGAQYNSIFKSQYDKGVFKLRSYP
jgi:hypothetical protein